MSEKKVENGLFGILKAILTPNFILIIIAMVFTQCGAGAYTAAMSLWAQKIINLSATDLGTAATLSFVAMMLVRPFAGKYFDSVGIKFQAVFGAVITAISIVLMGSANTFVLYALYRALYFATRSIHGTTTTTLGTFCSDRKYMGMNAALQTFLPSLVSAYAVLYARRLFDQTQATKPATIWYLIAAAYLITMIPLLLINLKDPYLVERQEALNRAKAEKEAEKAAKKGNGFNLKEWLYFPIIPIASLNLFLSFVTFSVEIVAVVLGKERGIDIVVYWLAGMAIFKAFGGLIGGFLADVFKRAKFTLPPCMIFAALSVVIVIFSKSPLMITIAGALFSFARNSMGPVMRKLTVAITPDENRGAMMSTTLLMTDLAGTFGSLLAGVLADNLGTIPTLWITFAFPLIGLVIFFLNLKKINEAEEKMLAHERR